MHIFLCVCLIMHINPGSNHDYFFNIKITFMGGGLIFKKKVCSIFSPRNEKLLILYKVQWNNMDKVSTDAELVIPHFYTNIGTIYTVYIEMRFLNQTMINIHANGAE